MVKRFAIILAAGKGTRMKSELHKMLHSVVGRPMIQHVIEQLQSIQLDEMATVVGHGAEEVTKKIGHESKFVTQEEQLGTGDRKSTRLNSSHVAISYAVFCLKKKSDGHEIYK